MGALIEIIAPVFLVIALGAIAARIRLVSEGDVDALMRLVHGILVPVLIFQAISRLDLGRSFDPVMLGIFYTGALSSFAAGALGARYFFGRGAEDSVAIGFTALFSNSLMLGLAITQRAYGEGALAGNYAIISLHAPICFAVGIITMELVRARAGGSAGAAAQKILRGLARNSIVIAVVIGYAVNISPFDVPVALSDALALIARSAIPLALLALGGVLARYRLAGDLPLVAFISILSLLVHPAIVAGLGALAGLDQAAMRSALVTAAMAPGVSAYVFANLYGVGQQTAAATVLTATVVSVVTVAGWLAYLG
jgi:predicted permease